MSRIGSRGTNPIDRVDFGPPEADSDSAATDAASTPTVDAAASGARLDMLSALGAAASPTASRDLSAVGEPLELPAGGITLTSGGLRGQLQAMLGALDLKGEVKGVHPADLEAGEPAHILVLCEREKLFGDDSFQISLEVDENGEVRSAGRLGLDLSEEINRVHLRQLERMTEEHAGANPSRAMALFAEALTSGRSFSEAFEPAVRELRRELPPGVENRYDEDLYYGLVPRGRYDEGSYQRTEADKASHIFEAYFPAGDMYQYDVTETSENAAFAWIREVGPLAGVDVEALEQLYSDTVADSVPVRGKGGNLEGRRLAMARVLEALPDGIGTADLGPDSRQKDAALLKSMLFGTWDLVTMDDDTYWGASGELVGGDSYEVTEPNARPLLDLIYRKTGVGAGDMASRLVRYQVLDDTRLSEDDPDLKALLDAVKAAVGGGAADPKQALDDVLEAFRRFGDVQPQAAGDLDGYTTTNIIGRCLGISTYNPLRSSRDNTPDFNDELGRILRYR